MRETSTNMTWTHEYDRLHYISGIPSIFTLTYEGEIHLDVKRTRDFYKHNPHWMEKENIPSVTGQHLIAIDRKTKIPQYLLVSTNLSCSHPQFDIVENKTYVEAMEQLQKYKTQAFEEHQKQIEEQNNDG